MWSVTPSSVDCVHTPIIKIMPDIVQHDPRPSQILRLENSTPINTTAHKCGYSLMGNKSEGDEDIGSLPDSD